MSLDTTKEEFRKQEWKNEEYMLSLKAADRLLDEPYSDPDDDIRTISRQFIRSTERMNEAVKLISNLESKIYTEIYNYIWEHRTADDGEDIIFVKFSKKDLQHFSKLNSSK